MKRFVADGLHGACNHRAEEGVINPSFPPEVGIGFWDSGMAAFPDINLIALVGYAVDGTAGGVDVLVEIAKEYNFINLMRSWRKL
jgi:hypothetical protein